MRSYLLPFLLVCLPLAAGCFQPLDTAAASKDPPPIEQPPPDSWPTTHFVSGPLPFTYFNLAGEPTNSDDPCDATRTQAATILLKYCAQCHGGRSKDERQGVPPFDFLLDGAKLTSTYTLNTMPPLLFVAPGDPEHSRLYLRAWRNEMPPPDLPMLKYQRPTVSDISVLHN